jgi:hypothetical protein
MLAVWQLKTGVTALFQSLEVNLTLRTLRLSGNDIRDDTIQVCTRNEVTSLDKHLAGVGEMPHKKQKPRARGPGRQPFARELVDARHLH